MNIPDIPSIPIIELIPQQPPFLFVARLRTYDDKASQSVFTVREGLPLPGASLLVEHIAQTCAARIGYYNKYILHRDVLIGYIGAIRHLHIYRQPRVGEELHTTIQELSAAFGLTLVGARVTGKGEEVIAEGEMKIALSEQ